MKTRLNRPQPPSRSRSRLYRLAGSALILAAALLFVPLSLGALVSFAPRAALPVGALPARAGGGLDISKSAVPSVTVDQGGTIVYTLVVTNNTGVNLENLVVTDTVPANTTCQTISGPPGWFYNAGACAAGLARWRLPPLGGLALNDGQTALFSYTVQVNLPLANGTVIRNGAGSYGVTAEEKGGPGTFADAGPANVDVTVNAPAWAIGKTASPSATVEAGNTVDYTLTVTNTGSLATSGSIIITDALPANTSFQSSSPAPSGSGGGVLTWTLNSTLSPGQATSLVWTARVTKPLAAGTVITNAPYGVSGGSAAAGVVNTTPITMLVTSGPALTVSKVANVSQVRPGDLITYTITYQNTGSNTGNGVTVTDTIPANTTFFASVPATQTQTGSRKFGWFTPTLPIDAPQVITLVVQVNGNLPNGTLLTNTVAITGSDPGLTPAGDRAVVTVVSEPVLNVTKTDNPDPVTAGDSLVYTITITNSGTATATNVVITDTLDGLTQFSAALPPPGLNMAPTLVFTLPQIQPGLTGTVIITAAVSATATHGSILSNRAQVTAAEIPTVTTVVQTTTVQAPVFTVTKSVVPATVLAGETITYTIRYTNSTTVPATHITLTDTLPLSLSAVFSDAGGAVFAGRVGNRLVFTRATLVSGSGVITIWGQVVTSPWPAAPYPLTNRLTATLDVPPTVFSHSVTSFGQPNVPAVMSLQVAPAAAVINSNIALTATMQDVYGNPVVNGQTVVYTSTLGGSSFSPASPNTAANGVVTASLTSTAAGTSTVTVKAGAVAQTAVVTFTAPRLRAVKTVNRNLVSPGDTLVYTITLTNGGDSDAGGVSITDTLDGQTAFVSALPAPVLTSPLVFSLGTLAPGISRTVVLTAAVNLDAVDQSVLRNAITATAIQTATAATAVATATVRGPAFAVAKSVAPQTAVAGQPLTFTIVYTSSGAVPVGGLRLTDTVPASITVQNVSAPAGNVALVGQTVVFSRPAPFNGVGVITISGQLTAAPWPATPLTLTNRATATINVNPTRFVAAAPVGASSGPPAVITITAVPSRTLINTSVAITAEIADRYGNPITNGQTVSFSSTLAGSSITPSSAPSAGGQVAAGLTSTAAGVTTVIVQVGSISRTAVVTFTAPSLALSKTGFPNPVAPGGTVVYTLVVSNTGNAAIHNVVVTDSLGSGLAFMSAAPPPSGGSGNSRTFTLASLGTGVTQTIVLTASVSAGEGAIVQNTASAKATETSLVQVTADTLVSAAPLSLSKSGAPDPVLAGGTLTYTISYRNNTGILLNNIRLTDTLPANFSLTTVNPGNASTVTVGPLRLVFTRSGLFPLAQESIVVVGQVPASPVPAGGMFITNAVTAALQLATAPLAAEAGVQVRPAAPASIVITASTLSTTVGSVVAITATVNDPFGNPAFNGTSVTFNTSATNTFVTSPQTTTNGSAVAALSATAAATTTVTANSGSAAGNSVQVVFNTAPVVMRPVYLPLILKRFTPPPPPVDLVVDSIAVSPAAPTTSQPVVISVTIRNTGTTAASGFWVDLYLTTEPVTPTINQLWNDLGSLGVAWQVPALAGGQAITLTNLAPNNYSNPADCQNYSYFTPEAVGLCTWPGNSNIFPAAGTYFATAQVDSFGEDSTPADGEVTETDESNNVFSTPVTIIVTGTPKTPAAPSRFPFAVPATPGRVRPPLR